MSKATLFRIVATVVATATTALQPFYGKQHWFVAVVAVASALALIAPSLVRSSSSSPTSSAARSTGGRLQAGGPS